MPASTGYEVIRQQLSATEPTRIDATEGNFIVAAYLGRNYNDDLYPIGNDNIVRTFFYDGDGRITGVEFAVSSADEDAIVICVGG